MHEFAEEHTNNEDEIMSPGQPLENGVADEGEEQDGQEDEEDEGGSLLLPIAGLLVILLCETALFLTSLSYGYTISSPKEL